MPAIAGPIVRAPLKIIELSAIALGRSSHPDHLDHERLAPGHIEGADQPVEGGQNDHVLDPHDARPGQRGEHERAQHQQRLVRTMIRRRRST